jgi:TetR/AcrR family transcriptional repressor of nem operon
MIDIIQFVKSGDGGMRASRDEMAAHHGRIVKGASRLLRERGVAGTSVADAMAEAGLTHGGFYRHFEAKDALVAEALGDAFGEMRARLGARLASEDPRVVRAAFRESYLSDRHVADPGHGCPMPTLAADVARESAALKEAFGAGLRGAAAALACGFEGEAPAREAAAYRELALLVGAVLLARASDAETGRTLLKAARQATAADD